MRLLLDTNVVVSALLWGGTPSRFIEAAVAGEIELVMSPDLFEELFEVLGRRHLASRLAQVPAAAEALGLYEKLAIRVTPLEIPRVLAADPDDDRVLACAAAGRVDVLVTGDHALLELASHAGIPILSPKDALERIASKP